MDITIIKLSLENGVWMAEIRGRGEREVASMFGVPAILPTCYTDKMTKLDVICRIRRWNPHTIIK